VKPFTLLAAGRADRWQSYGISTLTYSLSRLSDHFSRGTLARYSGGQQDVVVENDVRESETRNRKLSSFVSPILALRGLSIVRANLVA